MFAQDPPSLWRPFDPCRVLPKSSLPPQHPLRLTQSQDVLWRRQSCEPAGRAGIRFELVIKPQDRYSPGLPVPQTLNVAADEVIQTAAK
jgi:hypothetical protein